MNAGPSVNYRPCNDALSAFLFVSSASLFSPGFTFIYLVACYVNGIPSACVTRVDKHSKVTWLALFPLHSVAYEPSKMLCACAFFKIFFECNQTLAFNDWPVRVHYGVKDGENDESSVFIIFKTFNR